MEEIAEWFRRDLQRLLDMYKYKMSVPTIMNIVQDTCHKTLSIKEHPELHSEHFIDVSGLKVLSELLEEPECINPEKHINEIMKSGPSFLERHNIRKENSNA